MPNPTQPQVTNDYGVILTIGLFVEAEPTTIVLPVFVSSTSIDDNSLCEDAIDSFEATILPLLQVCVTSDAWVSFAQGEGMVDGKAPNRRPYGPTEFPGGGAAGSLPPNCGGLIVFYEDTKDVVSEARIRVAKNTIPGLPISAYVGGSLTEAQIALYQSVAANLQSGWPSSTDPDSSWYRGLASPKPRTPATLIKRVNQTDVRGYLGSQRRRLLPHLT